MKSAVTSTVPAVLWRVRLSPGPTLAAPSKTRQREVPVAIAPDDDDLIPRHRR
jgi:hypothetical protein